MSLSAISSCLLSCAPAITAKSSSPPIVFFKNKDGQYDSDFINCVAFAKTGEFIQKYFHKGDKIAITGRIQTGSYTNSEGNKVYTTDVIVDNAEFVESKGASSAGAAPVESVKGAPNPQDAFMQVPSGDDAELPF